MQIGILQEKLNLKDHPILPNQNLEYKVKDDLFLDDGDIYEELKDISKEFYKFITENYEKL